MASYFLRNKEYCLTGLSIFLSLSLIASILKPLQVIKDVNYSNGLQIKASLDTNTLTNLGPIQRLEHITNSSTFRDFFAVASKNSLADATSLTDSLVKMLADKNDVSAPPQLTNYRGFLGTPQADAIVEVLNGMHDGVYVECGAFDGETASNTLLLEVKYGWRGLLVEPNPFLYTQMRGRNRNAWNVNACMSPNPQPTMLKLPMRCSATSPFKACGQTGQMRRSASNNAVSVPCFTLASMLHAFNFTTVDYLSLDVEGFELAVLQNFPFDKFNIRTMSVEYRHSPGGKQALTKLLQSKGYRVFRDIKDKVREKQLFADDIIVVKDSILNERNN